MSNIDGLNNQNDHLNTYTRTILQKQNVQKPKKRRFWKWFAVFLVLLGVGAFVYGGTLINKANQIFTGKQSIFTRVGKLFVADDKPLLGEDTGRVNILLMGMGGPGHEGPLLTDTIIVASLDVKTGDVAMVSVPRDFMVAYSGRAFNKINAAYAFGEQNEENSGGQAAIDQVEKITGLEIPYFMAVDFKGFVKAVNNVGGIHVVIDRTFTDSEYPNYNQGYMAPQTFNAGPMNMDGETALIFARSRHGNNGEGSDFARSERQKKVMLAMKEKLMNLNINNVSTLNSLLSDFTENFRTNMEPHELLRLGKIGGEIKPDSVYSISLEPQGNIICQGSYDLATGRPAPAPTPVPTIAPTEGEDGGEDAPASESDDTPTAETPSPAPTSNIVRAYVVVPCAGKTNADIHAFLAGQIQTAALLKEGVTIEVRNSTGKASALNTIRPLLDSDLEITTKAYSGTPYERTVVHDNSAGGKPNSLKHILDTYGFSKADVAYTASTADIVIILGNDAL